MNRESKFRGKRLDNEQWVEGDRVAASSRVFIFYADGPEQVARFDEDGQYEAVFRFVEVDPATVGQWTGLKDKNGREIFEGDIVEWDDQSNGKWWRVAVVEISPDIRYRIIEHPRHPLSCPVGSVFEYGNFIYKDAENWLEIIGTVHDLGGGNDR